PPRSPRPPRVRERPHTKPRFAQWWSDAAERATGRAFTGADHYRDHTLLMHHSVLLGERGDTEDILTALDKVRAHADQLAAHPEPKGLA
ncbi:hypothetical protein ACFXO7_22825, partial [Nocardia tengchongensis]|uniref:hypothetical protein n=1 Tax=Nocardia tengchongensis TaxID=2055889 RepID=UPI0036BA64C3